MPFFDEAHLLDFVHLLHVLMKKLLLVMEQNLKQNSKGTVNLWRPDGAVFELKCAPLWKRICHQVTTFLPFRFEWD